MSLRYGLLALTAPLIIQSCKAPPHAASEKQVTTPASRAVSSEKVRSRAADAPVTTAQWVVAPNDIQDMRTYIAHQIGVARQDGKRVVVYVGATWCEPCQRFQDAVSTGALGNIFPGIRFLKFDADTHEQPIIQAGYASKYIPLFALPNEHGAPQGRQFMGAIKGDGAVPYIVPRLQKLLQGAH